MSLSSQIAPFLAASDCVERVSLDTEPEVLRVSFHTPDGYLVFYLRLDSESRTAEMFRRNYGASCNWIHDVHAHVRALSVAAALGYRTELPLMS